jgi:betaine-aldehyde dehydrogenase
MNNLKQNDVTVKSALPVHRGLFYGGQWHEPVEARYSQAINPATGDSLGRVAEASPADALLAIAAAQKGFLEWRSVAPLERGKILKRIAEILRNNAYELAMIDAASAGNPVSEMVYDAIIAAGQMDFFAGLVTEMKGHSIPMGPNSVNFSVREPIGVVARIIPFNHPFMFCAAKSAAPLAAGNSVIVKPPEQAPLSSLRFAELIEGLLPAGVFSVLPGGRDVGATLASNAGIASVAVVGSVATGAAVSRAAADTIKPVLLELGGKNALIAFPDADVDQVATAVVGGMNFGWCGQSCGSTSRAFIHESIYDAVLKKIPARCEAFKPGLPTLPETTMGCIVSKSQYDRILRYVELGHEQGARLISGGKRPSDPALKNGFFLEPTVFADATPEMAIASEEIFGPVLSILKWSDEKTMLDQVNGLPYGLTCSIWTNNLHAAHRTAAAVEAGYIWVNETSKHFLGAPFGGYKQSGLGREECLEELLFFTREKNIYIKVSPGN